MRFLTACAGPSSGYTRNTTVNRLVAYFGNDADRVECALFPARQALFTRTADQPQNGWGLGFVHGGDVLLQKRPRADAAEVDFFSLAKDLRADALVGCLGSDDDGRLSAENADPFRFRSWLFGAVGHTEGFDLVRERILQSVPEFLRRNIRGRSPSEHIFHLFLAFLHDAGLLEAQSPQPEAVQRALGESVAFVDRLLLAARGTTTKLAIVASNGRCLVASAHGFPIQFLDIKGIADCTACRQRHAADQDERRVSHDTLSAVILEADATAPVRSGWRAIPENGALVVGPDRIVRL